MATEDPQSAVRSVLVADQVAVDADADADEDGDGAVVVHVIVDHRASFGRCLAYKPTTTTTEM